MITELKKIHDPELGEILFRRNDRAKRYIIRCGKEKVTVTVPRAGRLKDAESFFYKNREKLIPVFRKMKEQHTNKKGELSSEEIISLKEKAIAYLPSELARIAAICGFQYKECKIGKSKTHWGSCSSSGTIHLSLYLMLLPENLIRYVLLHELCHTIHHNHGKGFWALMDSYTNNGAKLLQKELRKYAIPR